MLNIGKTTRFEVVRKKETYVKGRVSETITDTFEILGAIMPTDSTAFSDKATEILRFEPAGERITNHKKLFTTSFLEMKDRVTNTVTKEVFMVVKRYSYIKFGKNSRHYKYIVAEVEA